RRRLRAGRGRPGDPRRGHRVRRAPEGEERPQAGVAPPRPQGRGGCEGRRRTHRRRRPRPVGEHRPAGRAPPLPRTRGRGLPLQVVAVDASRARVALITSRPSTAHQMPAPTLRNTVIHAGAPVGTPRYGLLMTLDHGTAWYATNPTATASPVQAAIGRP